MIFNGKGTTRNVRESNKTITFLGNDPAQRIKICLCMTLVSPCMEGSLAKAAYNNDDSLCCNNLNFIVESN